MAAMKAGKGWWELDSPENVAAINTVEQFKDIMNPIKGTDQLVIVDFFAPWCRACRALNPKIAQIASVYPEVRDTADREIEGIFALSSNYAVI